MRSDCYRRWKSEMIDLKPIDLATVNAILAEHAPDCEVRAFGSRATWNAKDYSDLDLAVVGDGPLDWRVLGRLKEAFEESNLPMRVDVLDWHAISESFRKVVEQNYVVLQERPKRTAVVEWQEFQFAELLEEQVRNGIYKKKDFHGRGVKVVNMGELFANPRLRAIPMRRVELTDSELRRFAVRAGDLLFARRSLVAEGAGKCIVVLEVNEFTAFESSIIRTRPDPAKANSLFLYYYFNSPVGLHGLDTIRRQVAVAGITGSDLAQLPVRLPPLPEQKAIAHVLGTLDDKIELNRRMNETLEAMARALFKSWFVDFEPVRAKMEGRWRRGESLPGLPADLYDLFPDQLVPSELGEIPEGWEVRQLGDVADVLSGKRPKDRFAVANKEARVPLWGGNGPMAFVAEPLIDFPIVLTGRVGTLGSVFRITTPCWPSDNTLIFTPNSGHFFHCMFFQIGRIDFNSLNRGSTQPLITQRDLKAQLVLCPSESVLRCFESFCSRLFVTMDMRIKESRALSDQRDVLLPRLVSGEGGGLSC